MNFRFHTYFFLVIILSYTCGSVEETSEPVIETVEVEEKEEIDSVELAREEWMNNYITDYNVVEKLTKYGDSNLENKITIYTNYGKMKLVLYNKTPLHRANFVMLAKKKIFNNTMFYRVIKKFMIQGGNSDDEEIVSKMNKVGTYSIPNEITTRYSHKTGAIAMAVTHENQERDKKSSSLNFYIVHGQKLPKTYLDKLIESGTKITDRNYKTYLSKGGAAHLDGKYTVFGELVSGFSVLSRIANVKTSKYNWPKKRIVIDSIVAYN